MARKGQRRAAGMRRRIVTAAAGSWLVLGVAAAAVVPTEGPDPAAGLAVVDSLLHAGENGAAVEQARDLWQASGEDPLFGWQIAGRLGLALLRDGEPEAAVPLFERALADRPDLADLHRNLASSLRILGRKGRALAEYQTAADLAPADAALHLEYGQMLLEYRMWGRAAGELQLAAKLCGGCLDAERALANLYLASGDYRRAAAHLGRLWRRTRRTATGSLYASALAAAGEGRQALALLDSLPPTAVGAAEWKLAVQAEKDDPELGVSWSLRAVSRLDPSARAGDWGTPPAEGLFWAAAGGNLQRAGRPEPALKALDHALALDPGNAIYRRNRTSILLDLGRREEAEREWKRLAAEDSTHAQAKGQ